MYWIKRLFSSFLNLLPRSDAKDAIIDRFLLKETNASAFLVIGLQCVREHRFVA